MLSFYPMSSKESSIKYPNTAGVTRNAPTSVAFVHNFLDEYGLTPYEFRLYTHIVRRTGGKPEGVCFASLNKIAQICKMSPRKAQQAMKVLIRANLVTQTKRVGRTDEYQVRSASDWISKEELDQVREELSKASIQKQKDDSTTVQP